MKLFRSGLFSVALILGLLAFASPAGAQTLNSLTMEQVLALSGIQTTLTSNLPANVLASIASGALEIHQQTNYNPQASTLTSTFFLTPAGSTLPTNLGTVPASNFLATVAITTDKIYITKSAVLFVGPISQSSAPLLGSASYQGVPASVSFGYTTDTPPKIHDVVATIAGVGAIYTAAATGTFSISQSSTGGGPTPGGPGVTISVNGMTGATATFQTTVNQLTLDASASTSSNGGALTYTWSIAPNAPGAVISFPGGNSAIPFIQLSSGHQTYVINLTVTDSTGANATMTISIQYL